MAATRTSVPLRASEPVAWAEGAKGEMHAKAHSLRCDRIDSDGRRRYVGWRLSERPSRGQRGPRNYFWSNLGPQTALVAMLAYAHRQHWIEQ